MALNPDDVALSLSPIESPSFCRSNTTHIVWKVPTSSQRLHGHIQQTVSQRRQTEVGTEATPTKSNSVYECQIQTRKDAEKSCMAFLRSNVMAFDKPFLETMGFPNENDIIDVDGLNYGLVGPTVSLALDAKRQFSWTDDLPPDIFMNYVLNYANLNEARTNWRPLIVDALKFNESDLFQSSLASPKPTAIANTTSVTTWVNQNLWKRLARREDQPIYFKSSQTPMILDPMSTIGFGYASCTGTSILFCNALRSVGVPARVAGTPAWYGNRTQGNHNWVEVFVPNSDGSGGEWKFLEPSPALEHVDTLDNDACNRWFCDSSRFPASKVYAATLSNPDETSSLSFPLAWEWDCQDVPAVDRTDYYGNVCGSCGDIDGEE